MNEKALRLLSFLRYLYGECRTDFVKVPIIEKLKEYDLPQPSNISKYLYELKILERDNLKVKWIDEDGPTEVMVHKIFQSITEMWQRKAIEKKTETKAAIKPAKIETKPVKNEIKKPVSATKPSIPSQKESLPVKDFPNTRLNFLLSYSDEEVCDVLRNRGYKGKIECTKTIIL